MTKNCNCLKYTINHKNFAAKSGLIYKKNIKVSRVNYVLNIKKRLFLE